MGLSVFGSGLFTSLGNGVVSAVISFVRTMVFEIGAVFLLPLILGPDGIWLSFVVAEVAALVLSGACVIRFAPRYGYLPQRSVS
jgi:Na+-driven multidrug efflux pump